MGYCKQSALPSAECVSLSEVKSYLRVASGYTQEDAFITGLIQAAREQGEIISGRSLAKRTFTQVMDRFPDRSMSEAIDGSRLYDLGFFALPWNNQSAIYHQQIIKLAYPPVISVQDITYVDAQTGNDLVLHQDTDFVLDRQTDFARLVPLPGQFWPISMRTANAIAIHFTAGFDSNPAATDTHTVSSPNPPDQQTSSTIVTGVPQMIRLALLNLVAEWFQNRGVDVVPEAIFQIFRNWAVYTF